VKVFKGASATPLEMEEAAKKHYKPAELNYFEDMDREADPKSGKIVNPDLKVEEVKGRNAWVMWTGGNEAFWDWLARHSYGSIDLLKLIDSNDRGKRFGKGGLITEPGTRPPTPDETEKASGIRYDHPDGKNHVEHQKAKPPDPAVYGYP